MNSELRILIDDSRFREYHRNCLKPEFNTFDVLRYADYEIRHSNVLAWLLQPAETHGIEGRFLKCFVDHVNERVPAKEEPLPISSSSFEATNVSVEREQDYVDITIFFKKEQCLIAIENKTGPASSAHLDQVRRYQETLRGKYKNHTLKSVLLTTLPTESGDYSDIVQVNWKFIHKAISSFQENGKFRSDSVGAFVRQYLDLVERQFGFKKGGGTMVLLNDHRSILEKMLRLLEKDGADSVWEKVPMDRAEYCDALVSLVKIFRQKPKQLRKVVADHLNSQGYTTRLTQNAPKWYSVDWTDRELEEPSRILGGKSNFLKWSMTFTHRNVDVGFYFYQPREEQENPSPLDRLKHFIENTPINRLEPDKYRIKNIGFGWHRVYYHRILPKDEIADMSVFESQAEVLRWLEDYMGSNESDYRRINDYFRCLAFRPDVSTSTREESS